MKKILITLGLGVLLFNSFNIKVYAADENEEEIQEFINEIGEDCRQIAQDHDLYASVMIAQAIMESDWGTSGLSEDAHNLFGIKGWYNGECATYYTLEDDGTGKKFQIVSNFRKYPNWTESLEDYADLLTEPEQMGDYYWGVHKSNTNSYEDAADFLQGHYASDTSYAYGIKYRIDEFDLTYYDMSLEELAEKNKNDMINSFLNAL